MDTGADTTADATSTTPLAGPLVIRPRPRGWSDGAVSRGLAIALLAANIVVMGVFFLWQQSSLDSLERTAPAPPSLSVDPQADPELCWLIGTAARAEGKGKQLVTELSNAGTLTDCLANVMRGANGYGP